MDWKEEYKKKLVSPDEAVKEIRSGDSVSLGIALSAPPTLCRALARRKDELEGVTINSIISNMQHAWFEPGYEKAFRLVSKFNSPIDRAAIKAGRMEMRILANSTSGRVMTDRVPKERQVYMCVVSPPNENGYCSFGEMPWYAHNYVESSAIIIAEVTPGLIWTYGENFVHVSRIHKFAQGDPAFKQESGLTKQIGMVLKDDNERMTAEIIGALIAGELIKDGDVMQVGAGSISAAVTAFLHDKNDLGFHSEIIPGGLVDLVKNGVINGKTKKIHKGKLVAAGCFGTSKEELGFYDRNPMVELYRVPYVNDPRVISSNDNVVSVNNALAIDFSGQIAADSLGPGMYTGPGGQLDFAMGAMYSRGGRFVSAISSTAMDGKVSRIVPVLASGQGVTVPRYLADYVVTEHGIASLFGKSFKERTQELIAIAHPDFRSELKEEAKKMGYL